MSYTSSKFQELLVLGTRRGLCPGAALAVIRRGEAPLLLTAGRYTYEESSPDLRADSLFDVASLTKVLVTTMLVAQLWEAGQWELDELLTCFPGAPCTRQILAHCAGYAAEAKIRYLPAGMPDWPQTIVPEFVPGERTVYSDQGFILLGEALRRKTGKSLQVLTAERIVAPLHLQETCFCPPEGWRSRCVPTEIRPGEKLPVQGMVHDENAAWLGGQAGHAGLFASLRDLAVYAGCLLEGGQPLLSRPETLALFTRRANLVPGSSRCLGWDSPTPDCSGGNCLSPQAFGHTGFTGTSFWVDRTAGRASVLLANAIYPHREAKGKSFFDWRRQVHEAIQST